MKNIKQRLAKLEKPSVVRKMAIRRSYNGDVMACIEQDTARLRFYDKNGQWPPTMTRKEIRAMEADLALIRGTPADKQELEARRATYENLARS